MQISVVGGGYVGLVSAVCLAELGHIVRLIEIDQKKVDLINHGIPPIFELGLEEILKKNIGSGLIALSGYEEMENADCIVICVGTPPDKEGAADLSYIKSAAQSIGKAVKDIDKYQVITVKSTVPPGTTETLVKPIVMQNSGRTNDTLGFCMNPEFLREGRAIDDFMHPDRIVIGGDCDEAVRIFRKIYENLNAPLLSCSLKAAEMIKYASNAFLATKISFSNEIGNLCKKMGIDVYDVMKGVGYDHRINPYFLNAGLGFGGSCFPKDVSALVKLAEKYGEKPVLLKSVLSINDKQPARIVSLLEERIGSLKSKHIAVLGLAFKDNTDDVRDSRAIPVIEKLLKKGANVVAYDPMANETMKKVFPGIKYCEKPGAALSGADACLVLTEWPQFSDLNDEFRLMKNRVIIEGRRILSADVTEGVCW